MNSNPIQNLVKAFSWLPGVGHKTAARYVFHLLQSDPQKSKDLITALERLLHEVRYCKQCENFSTEEYCDICRSNQRKQNVICVVSSVADLWAMERNNIYQGSYHVLHGVLSPLDGIGPEQLKLHSLVQRIEQGNIDEVIIATNSDVNGETTALYLQQRLAEYPVAISRIASGIPTGGGLEYVDGNTLKIALDFRRNLS